MNFMFLPVGTVCEIVNSNEKIMIIGYDNHGNYRGVKIPQGASIDAPQLLLTKQDIVSIISLGYINDDVIKYSKSLINNFINTRKMPYQFDDKGFVIADNTVGEAGKYKFDDKGFVIADNTVGEAGKYKFDDKGFVIADNTVDEAGKYKFDDKGFVIADNTVDNAGKTEKYKFDENGVVVEDNSIRELDNKEKYKYDENEDVTSE